MAQLDFQFDFHPEEHLDHQGSLKRCERCGHLFTPQSFERHKKRFVCLSRSELQQLGLFEIHLSDWQIKIYNVESYWADIHMFDGLSDAVLPISFLEEKHPQILAALKTRRLQSSDSAAALSDSAR